MQQTTATSKLQTLLLSLHICAVVIWWMSLWISLILSIRAYSSPFPLLSVKMNQEDLVLLCLSHLKIRGKTLSLLLLYLAHVISQTLKSLSFVLREKCLPCSPESRSIIWRSSNQINCKWEHDQLYQMNNFILRLRIKIMRMVILAYSIKSRFQFFNYWISFRHQFD